jgi:ABC-type maltose transport system permease subunit
MWAGLAGAVFIMCIMLNSFGLAWASIAAKIWLMHAGMARFWLRGREKVLGTNLLLNMVPGPFAVSCLEQ